MPTTVVKPIQGRVRLCRIVEPAPGRLLRFDFSGWHHNDVMTSWAEIVGPLLRGSPDGKEWKIGGMYLEFENNGGAAVTPPDVVRTETMSYYDDLADHPTRDYLRAPLSYSTQDGSDLTFFARSGGLTGVHGKPCTSVAQSRFYGGALMAFPVFGDSTQDVIFSRFYFTDPGDQRIKGSGEIMFEWPLSLG